jgi:hypothetical protein
MDVSWSGCGMRSGPNTRREMTTASPELTIPKLGCGTVGAGARLSDGKLEPSVLAVTGAACATPVLDPDANDPSATLATSGSFESS